VEADAAEAGAVARIGELAAAGQSSREIARQLEIERDRFPPRGRKWHRTTVQRVLARLDGASAQAPEVRRNSTEEAKRERDQGLNPQSEQNRALGEAIVSTYRDPEWRRGIEEARRIARGEPARAKEASNGS
jgi:hypothetical protein